MNINLDNLPPNYNYTQSGLSTPDKESIGNQLFDNATQLLNSPLELKQVNGFKIAFNVFTNSDELEEVIHRFCDNNENAIIRRDSFNKNDIRNNIFKDFRGRSRFPSDLCVATDGSRINTHYAQNLDDANFLILVTKEHENPYNDKYIGICHGWYDSQLGTPRDPDYGQVKTRFISGTNEFTPKMYVDVFCSSSSVGLVGSNLMDFLKKIVLGAWLMSTHVTDIRGVVPGRPGESLSTIIPGLPTPTIPNYYSIGLQAVTTANTTQFYASQRFVRGELNDSGSLESYIWFLRYDAHNFSNLASNKLITQCVDKTGLNIRVPGRLSLIVPGALTRIHDAPPILNRAVSDNETGLSDAVITEYLNDQIEYELNIIRQSYNTLGIGDFDTNFRPPTPELVLGLDETDTGLMGQFSRSPSRSHSRSRSRSRSRSHSRSHSRSPARSRSRSPARSHSRSPARSPDRSPDRSPARSPPARSPERSPPIPEISPKSRRPKRKAESTSESKRPKHTTGGRKTRKRLKKRKTKR